jgi:hypothetical protein
MDIRETVLIPDARSWTNGSALNARRSFIVTLKKRLKWQESSELQFKHAGSNKGRKAGMASAGKFHKNSSQLGATKTYKHEDMT